MADGREAVAGATVLAIDASTYRGSVAVLRVAATGAPVVLARGAAAMRGADEERLMPAVAAALGEAGVAPAALGAVVCGGGPGSFTSLRIAGAIAKGLAAAARCPLVAAPSLALVPAPAGRTLVTLDAMRGERYAALVTRDAAASVVGYEYLGVLAAAAVERLAAERRLAVVDAGATPPAAERVADLALALGAGGAAAGVAGALTIAPVDLALWEPDYGRKAEAQVKWEAAHGRALPAAVG